MSEAEVHVVANRRRSREEAKRLVLEFEQSGQTRRAFCGEQGISPGTLDNYRKRLCCRSGANPVEHDASLTGMASQSTGRTAISFIPLEVIDSPTSAQVAAQHETVQRAALFVELRRGRRIGVASGFDATTLTRLIAALEQV
jgi:hypothetical protein